MKPYRGFERITDYINWIKVNEYIKQTTKVSRAVVVVVTRPPTIDIS